MKKLIRTTQWLAGREQIYVTVAVELATGERWCYAVNALRPMGASMDPRTLAPAGSTGTLTGETLALPEDADRLAAQLVVEAVGATPTISWKLQLSVDGLNWPDARYITDTSETAAVAVITRTTAGQRQCVPGRPRLSDRLVASMIGRADGLT